MTKKRSQYSQPTKANKLRTLMKAMSQEELQDSKGLMAAVKKARIKVTTSDIYRIRKEFVTAGVDEKSDPLNILKSIMAVKRTADQVGGLAEMKNIITTIERIQQ